MLVLCMNPMAFSYSNRIRGNANKKEINLVAFPRHENDAQDDKSDRCRYFKYAAMKTR